MGAQYVDHLERTVEAQDRKLAAVNTVIANLENTIRGKQALLSDMDFYGGSNRYTREFLRININELERILADLRAIEG